MCTSTCKHCDMPIVRPDRTNPWRAPAAPIPLVCAPRAGVSPSAHHEPAV